MYYLELETAVVCAIAGVKPRNVDEKVDSNTGRETLRPGTIESFQ